MFGFNRARPDLSTFGRPWPNRSASRFVTAGGLRFHVQCFGDEQAPAVLLVHGTGAATHSFRDLAPLLARKWRVVAFDLPGHGFTETPRISGFSLPAMAAGAAALMRALDIKPRFAIGHSAGAAILLEMARSKSVPFDGIIGCNSALEPMEGNALLSPMAKLLFVNPLVPKLVSWRARLGGMTETLLARTGSEIDAEGRALYAALFNDNAHVAGALGMMAYWELAPLRRRFATITTPVWLVAARDDPMVPASVSRAAAPLLPAGRYVPIDCGGHLLHEVEPGLIAGLLDDLSASLDAGAHAMPAAHSA